MAKRAPPVPPRDFTAFFYLVLLESDDLDDTLTDGELLERAEAIVGPRLAGAAVIRFGALFRTLRKSSLQEQYVHDRDRVMHFHPALLHAASDCKLRPNGTFPDKLIQRRIHELATGIYGDFSFDA